MKGSFDRQDFEPDSLRLNRLGRSNDSLTMYPAATKFRAARALLPALLAGCSAGSGEALDSSGRPIGEGGDIDLAPSLESIQANVFNPFCTICHSGAAAPLGLRLDEQNSYTALVGVPSVQESGLFRVSPADPGQSYLIRKLEGTASVGGQMPLGGPPIPQETINFVRQWIVDGALPVSAGPAGRSPVVVSLTPAADSLISEFPSRLVAGFDQEIDASTVNELTFVLLRSGGDGRFNDGNEVSIAASSVTLSTVNARVAIMDLCGVSPVGDRYRVILHGAGPNVIQNVGGQILDGDFTAEFDVPGLPPAMNSGDRQ
jgi:hypothetical protein